MWCGSGLVSVRGRSRGSSLPCSRCVPSLHPGAPTLAAALTEVVEVAGLLAADHCGQQERRVLPRSVSDQAVWEAGALLPGAEGAGLKGVGVTLSALGACQKRDCSFEQRCLSLMELAAAVINHPCKHLMTQYEKEEKVKHWKCKMLPRAFVSDSILYLRSLLGEAQNFHGRKSQS